MSGMNIAPTRRPPHARPIPPEPAYDPWLDIATNWPQVRVVVEVMSGDLLGEVRDGGALVALRADTSAAQLRCTLTHEIVHLERGLADCGPWLNREERQVHAEAARRLVPVAALADAIRSLGTADDQAALANLLDVDSETLRVRWQHLTSNERVQLRRALGRQALLRSVA